MICPDIMLQYSVNSVAGPGTKLSDKFTGTVCEIVSGDCMVVRDKANGQERRVNLSSIKAPRLGRKEEKPEPWATEAKEFLRQRLIGKLPLHLLRLPPCRQKYASLFQQAFSVSDFLSNSEPNACGGFLRVFLM